ncbi:hypothetical protein BDV93DRAFT_546748 [Ceratobasidium sp. AG-I]|nr:hypothetical protein BDV93DRAFT_546748 [Ceratobasidium sp. AG-I]
MFNRSPACEFWASFPFDHDSYISIEGTEAYTHSLGQELAPLRHLKSLRLGVYLMPSSAVLAHRVFHARKIPTPEVIEWQQAVAITLQEQADSFNPARPAQISDLISLLHRNPEQNLGCGNCEICWDQSHQSSREAESSGSKILKEVIPSLECVEWMDWFTIQHLGYSYEVS